MSTEKATTELVVQADGKAVVKRSKKDSPNLSPEDIDRIIEMRLTRDPKTGRATTYTVIAATIPCSTETAHRYYKKYLDGLTEVRRKHLDRYQEEAILELRQIAERAFVAASKAVDKGSFQAVAALLAEQRQAVQTILKATGLEGATKSENKNLNVNVDLTDVPYDELMKLVRGGE